MPVTTTRRSGGSSCGCACWVPRWNPQKGWARVCIGRQPAHTHACTYSFWEQPVQACTHVLRVCVWVPSEGGRGCALAGAHARMYSSWAQPVQACTHACSSQQVAANLTSLPPATGQVTEASMHPRAIDPAHGGQRRVGLVLQPPPRLRASTSAAANAHSQRAHALGHRLVHQDKLPSLRALCAWPMPACLPACSPTHCPSPPQHRGACVPPAAAASWCWPLAPARPCPSRAPGAGSRCHRGSW